MCEKNRAKHRRFILCLTALVVWSLFGIVPAAADENIIVPDSQSAISDSLTADSLPVDTAVRTYSPDDGVVLEPILYIPGEDTLLASYYRSSDTAVSRRSPTVTMFKSVVFPGWGQYSNGKYVKAAVVALVESYFIYKAVDYGRQASDWRDKWQNAPIELKGTYFNTYTKYRNKRNSNLWYTSIVVFLSMFDAYVDAHLQNFPSTDRADITVDMSSDGETRVGVAYRF